MKEPFIVTFDEGIDVEAHFKVKRAATTITEKTLEKHSHMRTTLPEDLHYDDKQLSQLFIMPTIVVCLWLNITGIAWRYGVKGVSWWSRSMGAFGGVSGFNPPNESVPVNIA